MKISIEVESTQVDEWIEEVTTSVDIFRTTHCGYWLRGVERDDALGWLVFDDESDFITCDGSAEILWRRGEKLPEGYYRLGVETARQAWIEGFKKWGVNWYHERDAEARDYAIQMAIFGEVVYG